jgi:hypothetical protein
MKKILSFIKAPLFLFLFFGILIYISFTYTTRIVEKRKNTIAVNAMQVQMQEELFRQTWNRSPSADELQGQIDNLVMDEIFYREAVALGLDKSDPAVKRRLRQMMELMLEDFSTIAPNENQLRSYLSENPDKFRSDPRLSFEHLYFAYDEKEAAEEFLSKLKTNSSLAREHQGGLSMIPDEYFNETAREVDRSLGSDFTQSLLEAEIQGWFGPVMSAYGWHLVNITEKVPGEIPELNEIWTQVEREWSAQRKAELKEEHYRNLKKRYVIKVETSEKEL